MQVDIYSFGVVLWVSCACTTRALYMHHKQPKLDYTGTQFTHKCPVVVAAGCRRRLGFSVFSWQTDSTMDLHQKLLLAARPCFMGLLKGYMAVLPT